MGALFMVHEQTRQSSGPSPNITVTRYRYSERSRFLAIAAMSVLPAGAAAVMWFGFTSIAPPAPRQVPGHLKAGASTRAERIRGRASRIQPGHPRRARPGRGVLPTRLDLPEMGKPAQAMSDLDRAIAVRSAACRGLPGTRQDANGKRRT